MALNVFLLSEPSVDSLDESSQFWPLFMGMLYDEAGHLLGEYSSTGALVQETVWLGDITVATIRPGTPAEVYYVHANQLNTPVAVTRPSDNKFAWQWHPDAFGNGSPSQNPQALGTFVYNLRMPGQYFDQETGLSQNYYRDCYDPVTGRFCQSDPVGLPADINTYAYVRGNPIGKTDPLGLSDVVYDRTAGRITIKDSNGNTVGTYPAGNNTTPTSNGPWPNGTYNYSNHTPHPESGPHGPYGSNGDFIFNVPGRTGMGIHSGRNGPASRTLGCIRTTDDATQTLLGLLTTDPLQTVTVQ